MRVQVPGGIYHVMSRGDHVIPSGLDFSGHLKGHSILVGAPGFNSQAGAAFLFSVENSAWVNTWVATGNSGANLGWAVTGIGDVKSNGWGTIVVGAPSVSHGYNYNGEAMAYYGTPNGPNTTPDWSVYGVGNYGQFGTSVAGGNVNGDSYQDVIIGAVGDPSSSPGNAYVFMGSSGGLGLSPASTLTGQAVGDQFGYL